MKVKIIASKPISENCSGIEEYIGQVFNTYINQDGKLLVKNNGVDDFALFDGEYEVIKE